LEEIFAKIHGVHHAVAVNSGTTALVAAMQVLGVRPGDEVITSPFSFAATLNAIIQAGGRARFADIRDDFTIDPDAVADLVNQRTVMLLPVHLYGLPADMEQIRALADRHGLAILEDAAQAVGATYHGQPVGSFGVGAFSLYATKNVTSGEGGVITTDDAAIADRLTVLRNQGMASPYQYEMPGHNYRLTDLQAALVVPQLLRLDQINGARAANAELLNEGLHDVPGLIPPHASAGRTHAWHQYTVRLLPGAPVDRDTFRKRLGDARIDTACYYPRLMHDYACYRDHPLVAPDPTPNAARIAQQVISLPVHPGVTRSDGQRIVNEVRCVMGA
jgi:dTDP-4-amino-4,6-dideoxygalactose transaminase